MRRTKKVFLSALSLLVFLLSFPLEAVHCFWSRWFFKGTQAPPALTIQEAFAETLATVEEAVKTMLKEADEIIEEAKEPDALQRQRIEKKAKLKQGFGLGREYRFYIGKKSGLPIAYVTTDTVQGKWGPIRYAVQFDPAGTIVDVIVLEYQEKRGRPVSGRRFLKQFIGKSPASPIRLQKDIRGVTGATISSRGMTDGIRKLTFVFQEFYGESS